MKIPSFLVCLSSLGLCVSGTNMVTAGAAKEGPAARVESQTVQERSTSDDKVAAPLPEQKSVLIYRPPLRGAPTRRVGGSSRAPGVPPLQLVVFATESTGLTMYEQPTLYWYVSQRVDVVAEFTLVDPMSAPPVVRATIEGPIEPGVHEVQLSKLGVSLSPGKDYEWSVALMLDPKRRSKDVVSSGTIRFVQPSNSVLKRIGSTAPSERQIVYADEGFWYDAISAVSEKLAKRAEDGVLKRQRASLLSQVGLHEYIELVDGR